MSSGYARAFCVAVALICGAGIGKAQPYRQLTADDFRGVPERSGDIVAKTACAINLQYDVHARNGYYQLIFHVGLEMDRNRSWLDRARLSTPARIAEVLKHEQGHYNISYMEQQELLRTFSRTRFDENYKVEVSDIFERIHAKYQQLNKDYDEDTDNSRNSVQQQSWDKYFRKRLAYMPPTEG